MSSEAAGTRSRDVGGYGLKTARCAEPATECSQGRTGGRCHDDYDRRFLVLNMRPTNVFASDRQGIGFVPHGLPRPTQARPGSAEKIAVLCDRLVKGYELWHPDDRDHKPKYLELDE